MSLITNRGESMFQALSNALTTADRIDIQTGFFYLSGFEALAEELENKHVRVLVGMEIEPSLTPLIARGNYDPGLDLNRFRPRFETTSMLDRRNNYINGLVGIINDTDLFESPGTGPALELFLKKIENGSLEIRRTRKDHHGKMYLVHNRSEVSQRGQSPGTRIVGSSNFTYSGLVGQGEINALDTGRAAFEAGLRDFELLWSNEHSISIADEGTRDLFVTEIRKRTWRFQQPTPFDLYVRVLDEYFAEPTTTDLKTPNTITDGQYWDLQYQIDAIRLGLDRIGRYSGAILADVAGLGKSVIASAIAKNIDLNTVIICPPHMIDEWEDYKEDFGIRGPRVFSSGLIKDVYERYKESPNPILLILDEAHRYRNEDTLDYQLLHQITRSHPENKVLLLTATPFNNAPKDLFALMKLFQTPGKSTIRTVEKLGLRFRELVSRYQTLRRGMNKGMKRDEIEQEAREIADEQRMLIEPVVIRRSRLDLKAIQRYREDLERQAVGFSDVTGPDLLEYDLGKISDIYLSTLSQITEAGSDSGYIGARYLTTNYVEDLDALIASLEGEADLSDIRVAQTNLAKFMRRLLVMRFESSKEAFRLTLESMINAHEVIERWWDNRREIPILKKGSLPDPDMFAELEEGEPGLHDEFESEIARLKRDKGLICIPIQFIRDQFLTDLKSDIQLLKSIHRQWFGNQSPSGDPKIDCLAKTINSLMEQNPSRKIVVFSMFADTVTYVANELSRRGVNRVIPYTAATAGKASRKLIKENFDASVPKKSQSNDYDVVIATDALSEGINLHRAGVIINYDIPYNPTRVIQRIGRINRIDKKTFDTIQILNAFPTAVGESETRIKQISTLKILLINQIVGADHKVLTSEEEVATFFRDEFAKAESDSEAESWDTPHRATLEQSRSNAELMTRVRAIPHRSRVARQSNKDAATIAYGKRNNSSIFAGQIKQDPPRLLTAEQALSIFRCEPDSVPHPLSANFEELFHQVRTKLFELDPVPPVAGRREKALSVITALGSQLPSAGPYCDDLARLIKEYDDVNDGVLKQIAGADLTDLNALFALVQRLVPPSIIHNCFKRAANIEEDSEIIVLVSEIRS